MALRVEVSNGRIDRVAIDRSRPVRTAGILEGRTAESALETLPRLFGLCGTAQSVAGLRALEAAFDCGPGPVGRVARSLLVAFEALEQTLWRILLDWPRCLGNRGDAQALKFFRTRIAELQRGVFADPKWNRLGGARVNGKPHMLARAVESITRDIEKLVFGGTRCDAVVRSRAAFAEWVRAGRSPTAEVFAWIADASFEDFGGVDIRPADDFDTEYLADRLARDDAWEFCAQPDDHGEVPQTGALSRLADAPLVRELHADYGYGLYTQLAARLLEVPKLLEQIREGICALAPEGASAARAITSGRGFGSVDTARGRLFHWVEVRNGNVSRYRTLAPTEWNFHSRGPLARGLVGASAKDGPATRRAVDLLVAAIDPCVGIELEIAEA